MELMKASNQWSRRPADERFWNLDEMLARTDRYKNEARAATVRLPDLEVIPTGIDNGLVLKGKAAEANFTHWSFSQLCSMVGAPSSYLRQIPAEIVADALNHGMKSTPDDESDKVMLLNANGDLKLRAITSDKYARIWNSDIVRRIMPLREMGWKVPPARPNGNDTRSRVATAEDCMPGSKIQPGELIAPAGLYASDRDMFAFLINCDRPIMSGKAPMYRGFFAENSEVGSAAFKLTTFLLNTVCGNHIVWGASEVNTISIRHLGGTAEAKAFGQLRVELTKYADSSANDMNAVIEHAQTMELGANKDEVLDFLFAKRLAPRATLEGAYLLAEQHPEDGADNPRSVWGMVQGITRLSQEKANMDERVALDRVGGKILEIAF
jgi:hypothetical protein